MLDCLVHLSELLLEKVALLQYRLDALSPDHTERAATAERLRHSGSTTDDNQH